MDAWVEQRALAIGVAAAGLCWLLGALGGSAWWIALVVWVAQHAIRRRIEGAQRAAHLQAVLDAISAHCDTHHSDAALLPDIAAALPRGLRLPPSFGADGEPAAWANALVARLWAVVEPTLSAKLANQLNIALQENVPAFVDAWEMREMTLGSRPPYIASVRVLPDDSPNRVRLDMRAVYVPQKDRSHTGRTQPADVCSATGQGRATWDARVVVAVRLRTGPLRAALPLVFRNISIAGTVRVVVETAPVAPFFSRVQLCFADAPLLDFGLAPSSDALSLRGALDLMDLPGLSHWLAGAMADACASLCVHPNYVTIPIDRLAALSADVCAIGVLRVTVWSVVWRQDAAARGERGAHALHEVRVMHSGRVRAVSVPISRDTGVWLSRAHGGDYSHAVSDSSHTGDAQYCDAQQGHPVNAMPHDGTPVERQVFYLLVHSRKHPVVLCLADAGSALDDARAVCATVAHPLSDTGRSFWRTLATDGAPELHYGVEVLQADAPGPAAAECSSGIANISVWQIRDLFADDAATGRRAGTVHYEVHVHDPRADEDARVPSARTYRSRPRRHAALPSWDDVFEVFVEDTDACAVSVRVFGTHVAGTESRHHGAAGRTDEPVLLASWSSPLRRLIDRTDWFRMDGAENAQFYASFLFRPVSLGRSSGPSRPIAPATAAEGTRATGDLQRVLQRGIARQNQMMRALGVAYLSDLRVWLPSGLPLYSGCVLRADVSGLGALDGDILSDGTAPPHVLLVRDTTDALSLAVHSEDGKCIGRAAVRLDDLLAVPPDVRNPRMSTLPDEAALRYSAMQTLADSGRSPVCSDVDWRNTAAHKADSNLSLSQYSGADDTQHAKALHVCRSKRRVSFEQVKELGDMTDTSDCKQECAEGSRNTETNPCGTDCSDECGIVNDCSCAEQSNSGAPNVQEELWPKLSAPFECALSDQRGAHTATVSGTVALHVLQYDDALLLAGVSDAYSPECLTGRTVVPKSKAFTANCGVLDVYRIEAVKLANAPGRSLFARVSVVPYACGDGGVRLCSAGAAPPGAEHVTVEAPATRGPDGTVTCRWDRLGQLVVVGNPQDAELRVSIHDASSRESLGAASLPLADARCDDAYALLCSSGFVSVRMALHRVGATVPPRVQPSGYVHVHVMDARLTGCGTRGAVVAVHVGGQRVYKTEAARSSAPVWDELAWAFVANRKSASVVLEVRECGRMRGTRVLGRTSALHADAVGVWGPVETVAIGGAERGALLRIRLSFVPALSAVPEEAVPVPAESPAVPTSSVFKALRSASAFGLQDTEPAAEGRKGAEPQALCVEIAALRGLRSDDASWRIKVRRGGRTVHKTPASRACRWLDEAVVLPLAGPPIDVVAVSSAGERVLFESLAPCDALAAAARDASDAASEVSVTDSDAPTDVTMNPVMMHANATLAKTGSAAMGDSSESLVRAGHIVLRARGSSQATVELEVWPLAGAPPEPAKRRSLVSLLRGLPVSTA